MSRDFTPAAGAQDELPDDAYVFAFRERDLLAVVDATVRVPAHAEVAALSELTPVRRHFLGTFRGKPVSAWEMPADAAAPAGMAWEGLRALFLRLEDALIGVAGRAIQIVEWARDHRFCGRCASPTVDAPADERAKQCPSCGLTAYPRVAPAVIVLVERGDEMLLARSPHFTPGVFSTLAGFVEPGESLEQAVAREIFEEVGVEVDDLRYFGSQPWPFPHSLMVGFRARYAGGELAIDGREIVEAGWFGAGNLPGLPSQVSIARALIESFLAERR